MVVHLYPTAVVVVVVELERLPRTTNRLQNLMERAIERLSQTGWCVDGWFLVGFAFLLLPQPRGRLLWFLVSTMSRRPKQKVRQINKSSHGAADERMDRTLAIVGCYTSRLKRDKCKLLLAAANPRGWLAAGSQRQTISQDVVHKYHNQKYLELCVGGVS